jgi:hypothetical protein
MVSILGGYFSHRSLRAFDLRTPQMGKSVEDRNGIAPLPVFLFLSSFTKKAGGNKKKERKKKKKKKERKKPKGITE